MHCSRFIRTSFYHGPLCEAKTQGLELVMFYTDAVSEADFYNPTTLQRKLTQPGALMPLIVAPGMDVTEAVVQLLNRTATTPGAGRR